MIVSATSQIQARDVPLSRNFRAYMINCDSVRLRRRRMRVTSCEVCHGEWSVLDRSSIERESMMEGPIDADALVVPT